MGTLEKPHFEIQSREENSTAHFDIVKLRVNSTTPEKGCASHTPYAFGEPAPSPSQVRPFRGYI
jgi:hypothetical protein